MTDKMPGRLEDEALEWFVALRDNDVTDEVRSSFERWRNSSEAHDRAFIEAERLWSDLDILAPASAGPAGPTRRAPKGGRRRVGRSAAATLLSLIASVALWPLLPHYPFADHSTSIGERTVIRLSDGSTVELGADSAIDVEFDGRSRNVTLLGGEAYFTVTKDPSRTFYVHAGDGEIRVLGTEFNVDIRQDVSVAVAHNAVEVSASSRAVGVKTGDMLRYGASGMSGPMPADMEIVQAWRRGRLVYRDASLADVVADLRRYKRGRIEIVGSGLAAKRLTAVFDVGDADDVLNTIAEGLGLSVYEIPGVLTVVTR